MNKETTIGLIAVLVIISVVETVTGIYGFVYLGLALLISVVSMYLFARKSMSAKTTAIALNPNILYKFLLPKKYKKAIKELSENEDIHTHN